MGSRKRCLRDSEILDREPGRVEESDIASTLPSLGGTDQHGPELGDVFVAYDSCAHASGELAAVTRLLPGMARRSAFTHRVRPSRSSAHRRARGI